MGLFQKNPFSTEKTQPLYTLGLGSTVLIVGLGNVGEKYSLTRHNIGFRCIDEFAKAHQFDDFIEKKDFKSQTSIKTIGSTRVVLVKPTTMMNLSGEAVQKVAHFYKIEFNKIVAVYDELAIPFGQIRTRMGGSAAGHNGVKSLINHIGDEFGRIRIGIQPDSKVPMDMSDYVLARFSSEEERQIGPLTREATSILTEYVMSGELPHETRSFIV